MSLAVPDRAEGATVAGLYDAWAGGGYATDDEKALAARLAAIAPMTRPLMDASRAYHAAAAERAAAAGMSGIVVAPAGFPARPEPYQGTAAGRVADVSGRLLRVVYADCDDRILQAREEHTVPGTWAVRAAPDDPAAVLDAPETRALTADGPVQVQVPMALQWLSRETCARIIAGYAAILARRAPGSEIVITSAAGESTPLGREFARLAAAAGTLQAHSLDAVRAWCARTGRLRVDGAIADVRAHGQEWAHEEFGRTARSTGRRVVAVTATVLRPGPVPAPARRILGPAEWAVLPGPAPDLNDAGLRAALSAVRAAGCTQGDPGRPVSFQTVPEGAWHAMLPAPAVLHYANGRAVVHCAPGTAGREAAAVLSRAASLAVSRPGIPPAARVEPVAHGALRSLHPGTCYTGPEGMTIAVCGRLISPELAAAAGPLLTVHLGGLRPAGQDPHRKMNR